MRCGAVRCGAVRCGAVRCGAVRCGAVRCGAARCGAVGALATFDGRYCNRCKDHVQASKCMAIWTAPEVLVLHLKRFEYRNVLVRALAGAANAFRGGGGTGEVDASWRTTTRPCARPPLRTRHARAHTLACPLKTAFVCVWGGGACLQWRDKLDTLVEFPLLGLNMAPYVLSEQRGAHAPTSPTAAGTTAGTAAEDEPSPLLYDCFGVVNHYGSMAFGHYTAFTNHAVARGVADPDGAYWHLYDDSAVRSVAASEVVSGSAYVLFYRRRPGAAALLASAPTTAPDAAAASKM